VHKGSVVAQDAAGDFLAVQFVVHDQYYPPF
jgi:hypothetical protein